MSDKLEYGMVCHLSETKLRSAMLRKYNTQETEKFIDAIKRIGIIYSDDSFLDTDEGIEAFLIGVVNGRAGAKKTHEEILSAKAPVMNNGAPDNPQE